MAGSFPELSKLVATETDELLKRDYCAVVTRVAANKKTNKLIKPTGPCIISVSYGTASTTVIQVNSTETLIPRLFESSNSLNYPIAIITISVLQIVCYLYDILNRRDGNFSKFGEYLLFKSTENYAVWRYFTYMLLHFDAVHLYSNLFWQLLMGVPLEVTHGWRRVTLLYLIGGLGGSLGVASLSTCVALIGGSAGVFSLLGAHFSHLILNWNETEYRLLRVFLLIVNLMTEIFNFISIRVIVHQPKFTSFTCILVTDLSNSTITHVCGFIVGILLGVVILKNFRTRIWEHKLQFVACSLLSLLIVLTICLIIIMPKFDVKEFLTNYKCVTKIEPLKE